MRLIPLVWSQFASSVIAAVPTHEFCQMMTRSRSAICHLDVCRDGERDFSDPLLQNIDCSADRIIGINLIYIENRQYVARMHMGLCLIRCLTYLDLIKCRAGEVREGSWERMRDPLPHFPTIAVGNLLASVPGAFKPHFGYSGDHYNGGIWSDDIDYKSLIDSDAVEETKENQIELFSEFVPPDIAGRSLLPLTRDPYTNREKLRALDGKDFFMSDTELTLIQNHMREFVRMNLNNPETKVPAGVVVSVLKSYVTMSSEWMVPGDRVAIRDRIKADNSRYRIKQLPSGTIVNRVLSQLERSPDILDPPLDEKIIKEIDNCLESTRMKGFFRGLVADAGGPRPWEPSTEFYNPNGVFTVSAVIRLLETLGYTRFPWSVDYVPTLLKIISQLDLETLIHNNLVDCREVCSLRRNVLGNFRPPAMPWDRSVESPFILIEHIILGVIKG
jgi:hypothetical protein